VHCTLSSHSLDALFQSEGQAKLPKEKDQIPHETEKKKIV
jgi:hypothetical protein